MELTSLQEQRILLRAALFDQRLRLLALQRELRGEVPYSFIR